MSSAFLAMLVPLLTLFTCIVIGFTANKTKILPENSSSVMAKLMNYIFVPALSFYTQANYFRPETIRAHAVNILFGTVGVLLAISIATLLVRFFANRNSYEYGVYAYALAFANSGYMGDPIVRDMFDYEALSYYKLFCLPISLAIYSWGMIMLIPKDKNSTSVFKKMLNPPTIAMLLGMIVGISGLYRYIPSFINNAIAMLMNCMGPVAMLLAGFSIAKYDLKSMLSNKKIYIASVLRLTAIPTVIISILFSVKQLVFLIFDFSIPNTPLFLSFFAIATPLGLNTIVFPEAYGGNPKTGAGMTLVSHALSIITVPLFYSLMVLLFGAFTLG